MLNVDITFKQGDEQLVVIGSMTVLSEVIRQGVGLIGDALGNTKSGSGPSTIEAIEAWQTIAFPKATIESTLHHLRLEMDELTDALRGEPDEIAGELADLMHFVIQMASMFNIDMQDALDRKFALNLVRKWPKEPDANGIYEHLK